MEVADLDLPAWAGDVWGLELELPSPPLGEQVPIFRPIPAHEGVERDLALLLPVDVSVESALSLVRARGGADLREVEVFDVYRGTELPDGLRSVAVRLRYRAFDRTLRDEEVDDAIGSVTRALEEELSVGIRGKIG